MDDEVLDEIAGALTAYGVLLETLYCHLLAQDADPAEAGRRLAAEMLRQFEDMPTTSDRPFEADEKFRIIQHGLHRLERFWAGVDRRLASAGYE